MICFDTTPIIWGFQGFASPAQHIMIDRAKEYFEQLSQEKRKLMLPTPALSEFLIGVSAAYRDAYIGELKRTFLIAPFDLKSAIIAAELEGDRKAIKQLRLEGDVRRQGLRIDAQIIAVAIAFGAEKIITNDIEHFKKLARDRILIEEIPALSQQSKLF